MEPEEDFTAHDRDLLERTFKLARDNNRMLQSMSRAALFNGLFRFLAWAVVLGGAIWLYMNYLGPTMEALTNMVGQAQGASADANEQFNNVRSILDSLQNILPNTSSGTTTTQ